MRDDGRQQLVAAVPKGRVLEQLGSRLEAAGIDPTPLGEADRRLIRNDADNGLRFLLVKPDDVPTYVDYGVADVGVVGRDVLLEQGYDLYAPLDLGIGRCRMVVAGAREARTSGEHHHTLRVATKYPNLAWRHFMAKGQPVEIIYVQGSVELAPMTGLAEVIVDLVESGETLRQNDLAEVEEICEISSVVVANRVGLKLKRHLITPLLQALRDSG